MLCILFALLLSFPLQVHLTNGQVAVATTDGVFLVQPGSPAVTTQLLTPPDVGLGTLVDPAITWLRGTDSFMLITLDVAGASKLVRIDVGPGPSVFVDDLTSAILLSPAPVVVDLDYSTGLDTLFLLDALHERVLALEQPATASGTNLSSWTDIDIEEPRSIAVHGAQHPFGVIVVGRFEVHRYTEPAGKTVLFDQSLGEWDQVDDNAVTAEFYLLDESDDEFGQLFASGLYNDFNFPPSGGCQPPISGPADMEWDPVTRKMMVLAGNGVDSCFFGASVVGPNHVVLMPYLIGGPPGNVPKLFTPAGPSGISGNSGDLALVRGTAADVTFYGQSATAGSGDNPTMIVTGLIASSARLDQPVSFDLVDAPASALAQFVLGFELNIPFKGQVLYPAPLVIVALASDGAGSAKLTLNVPDDPALLGFQFWTQWWFDDNSTPTAGDLVSSHAGIYTIGLK